MIGKIKSKLKERKKIKQARKDDKPVYKAGVGNVGGGSTIASRMKGKVKSAAGKVKSAVGKAKEKRKFKKGHKSGTIAGPTQKTTASKVKSKLKSKVGSMTSAGRAKKIGAAKGTKVSKGAVGVQKTKGGDYVKYKKDSKAAGSFRSAFKSKCAGGSKGFTWQGRKYSCAKK